MRIVLPTMLIMMTLFSCNKNKSNELNINKDLQKELLQILELDQGIRKLTDNSLSQIEKDSILTQIGLTKPQIQGGNFWRTMQNIDSVNLSKVEKIIKVHGYPGKSIVGEPANNAAFYVIQHSNKIEQYLPLVEEASHRNEISVRKYVIMKDRYLMNKGEEQIYGTQVYGLAVNGEWLEFIWPIKDAENINQRRKKIGLNSIEEYANEFGLNYEFMSLEKVKELLNN